MKEEFGMHFCPNCGHTVSEGKANYCSGCGMNLRQTIDSHSDKEMQRPTRRIVTRAGISGWQIIAAVLGFLLIGPTIGLLVLLILVILGVSFIMTLIPSYVPLASVGGVIGLIGIGALIDVVLFLSVAHLLGYAFKARVTVEEFEK